MMFRLMYRLKKKHGAVLFAVIAVMALLIAMSTAAYFTARGSYNSVASSYSYSQLYLSAISAADMISDAIMNAPITSATLLNNFDDVKDAIRDDLNNVGDTIYLKSSNLSGLTVNASTSPQDVIDALNAADDPIVAGALDGLTVEIKVEVAGGFTVPTSGHDYSASTSTVTIDDQTGTTPFTYSVTTTAYYNDNTITVQDIIKTEKKGTRRVTTPNPTPGGGGGASALPSDFNPNIATGQGQPGTDGKATDPGRTVIVSVKEMNGDMAFRNDKTMIGSPNFNNVGNKLDGGLISEGSIYLVKGGAEVTGTEKNWYVSDNLVVADAQAKLDLGQNDLYVGGDLVLGANGGSVKARDVYVNGDLYVLDAKTLDVSNLHVNGNIYYALYDEDGKLRTDAYDGVNLSAPGNENVTGNLGGNFNLFLNGHVITEGKTATGGTIGKVSNVKLGNKYTVNSGDTHSESNGIGGFTIKEDETKNPFTVLTASSDGNSYDKVSTEGTATDALEKNTNWSEDGGGTMADKSVYPNYTAGQQAYDNEATIDFGLLDEVKDSEGNTTGYRGEFPIGDTGEYIVVTIDSADRWNTDDIQIDIPYVKDGFTLKYESTSESSYWDPTVPNEWGGLGAMVTTNSTTSGLNNLSNQNILHYNIETASDGSSMPIVLAANKENGNFCWSGDSSVKGADVSVNGNGKVTFEMGNYNPDTGKYEPFRVEDASKYQIPTYEQGKTGQQFTLVGSSDQLDEIGRTDGSNKFDGLTAERAKTITQRSNVMLVSNKSGEAFKADGKDGLFCGYIYAPNGTLTADNDTNGCVISVGSIVISSYEAQHADYHVSLPSPNDMNDFMGALNGDTGVDWGTVNGGGGTVSPGSPGSPGGPSTSTPITYSGFENWTLVGGNYIGEAAIPAAGGSEEETPAA